jgi:hypothetical protein
MACVTSKEFLLSHPEILAEILQDEFVQEVTGEKPGATFSNRSSAPRNRNRGYALQEMEFLTAAEFKRMFRLSREAFYWLLSRISREISPQP